MAMSIEVNIEGPRHCACPFDSFSYLSISQ
jgi:hypothetical protein